MDKPLKLKFFSFKKSFTIITYLLEKSLHSYRIKQISRTMKNNHVTCVSRARQSHLHLFLRPIILQPSGNIHWQFVPGKNGGLKSKLKSVTEAVSKSTVCSRIRCHFLIGSHPSCCQALSYTMYILLEKRP